MSKQLSMTDDEVKRFMQAQTLEECKVALKEIFPELYPDVYFDMLPDVINHHINAVARRTPKDPFDPPGDPNWVFKNRNK